MLSLLSLTHTHSHPHTICDQKQLTCKTAYCLLSTSIMWMPHIFGELHALNGDVKYKPFMTFTDEFSIEYWNIECGTVFKSAKYNLRARTKNKRSSNQKQASEHFQWYIQTYRANRVNVSCTIAPPIPRILWIHYWRIHHMRIPHNMAGKYLSYQRKNNRKSNNSTHTKKKRTQTLKFSFNFISFFQLLFVFFFLSLTVYFLLSFINLLAQTECIQIERTIAI